MHYHKRTCDKKRESLTTVNNNNNITQIFNFKDTN